MDLVSISSSKVWVPLLSLLITTVFVSHVSGQVPVTNYRATKKIEDKDLCLHLTRQSDGFYWYGNASGLHRFDGQQRKQYAVEDATSSVVHNQFVTSRVMPDTAGLYWFTTYQALHKFNPVEEKFKTLQLDLHDQSLNRNYNILYFDEARQELLVVADTVLFAFNVESHAYRPLLYRAISNSYHAIDNGGAVHFFGAPWWTAKGFEYFRYAEGEASGYRHVTHPVMIKSIAPYSLDSIYLATPAGLQLLKHPLDDDQRALELVLPGEARNVSLGEASGGVLVSIDSSGVFELDPTGGEVKHHWTAPSELSGNDSRQLTMDEEGNLFVSHLTDGVDVLLAPTAGITFTASPFGRALADLGRIDDDQFLVTFNGGPAYRYRQTASGLTLGSPLAGYDFTAARIDQTAGDALWLHERSGLTKFSLATDELEDIETPYSIYCSSITFERGEVLFLCDKGIMELRGGQEGHPLPGLPFGNNDYFTNLIKLHEDRFLASYREIELWDVVRTAQGWAVQTKWPVAGEVHAAHLCGDTLHLGSSAGLLTVVGGTILGTFNPTPFGNLWVNALHEDARGRLWLGTEQGLFCYQPATGAYQFYGTADGIPDEWFIRANVFATDSSFTMATKSGLVTVDTRLADRELSDNTIYLSDIWVNGIRKADHSLYAPKALDLDYRRNAVSFLPGMIELSSSDLSGFEYRMEGLEEQFTYSQSGEVIRYSSLPPGGYTFEVVGVDRNGRRTEAIRLPVTIAPPFYKTWWFWLTVAAVVLTAFYMLNRRAVRRETLRQQVIQQEQARKADERLARHQAVVHEQRRIMQELHDDLGGTLSGLFYTLDGYLLDQESGQEVSLDLQALSTTSKEAIDQLRQVMNNNRASPQSVTVFARKLTDYAREFARNTGLKWSYERDEVFVERNLSGYQVHNIFLIFKEALNNVRKHAKAANFCLGVHFEAASDELVISLTDDGVGLPETAAGLREDGGGNGLLNMRSRATDLGGRLTFYRPDVGGTRLVLSLPLPLITD